MATKIYIKETYWVKPAHVEWNKKRTKQLKKLGKLSNKSIRVRKFLDRQMKRYPQG